MRIYVAGEVLREESATAMWKSLLGLPGELSSRALRKTYRQIKEAAYKGTAFTNQGIELSMPFPDPQLDTLEPGRFVDIYGRKSAGQMGS